MNLTKSQLEIIEFTRKEFNAYPYRAGMYELLRLSAILKWPDHAELFGPSFTVKQNDT